MTETISTSSKAIPQRRDWTQGPILKNLLLLSWPMIVMEATYMVSQILDMIWVGKAGSTALAAIGIAMLVVTILSTVDIAIIGGTRAMIARFMGAGDYEGARRVAAQAYILAATWGVLVTICGFLLSGKIMGLFGVAPDVIQEGTGYLQVIFAGWLSLELLVMGLYIMQSSGDSMNPMITEIVIRSVHIAVCPFLVLGLWIFPAMGIAGAALSNVIAQILGAIAGFWFIFGGKTRLKLTLKDIRFRPNITWRLLKIGIPSFFSILQNNLSSFLLTRIMAPFGTAAVAAHSMANTVQGLINTPNIGMGSAVGVLVGQNLGAKQPQRATRSTWLGIAILEGLLVTCGIIVLITAERIVGIFNSDPAVIEIGSTFLRITTVGFLVMGFNVCLSSCLNGSGDTLPNMIINISMTWIVQIPLAYVLSHYTGLDANGVRWAMVIGFFVTGIAAFSYFRTGRWKTKRI